MTDHDPRLPDHVVPHHYELELAPDIDAATFAGSVRIDAELRTPSREIVCNAADLEIERATIEVDATTLEATVRLDPETERLHLGTDEALPSGPIRLHLTFRGVLNDKLRGFYRSTFTDDDGTTHAIATSQFQSTDARRAFPCWDEPAWKATFATTLVVADGLLAVTNTSLVDETELDDGRRRLRFRTTMPMSTYLVAFVVGPLEVTDPVDVRGVPVRVVHRPGKAALASFAVDVTRHALEWFSDYYGIDYPSDKLDLVAIPDFAFGAMENLGCVNFREALLLVDPESASQPELQLVAAVVSHEIAHMWFGDLVTMRWWEGIWLNEAFATFMETACTDALRPDWDVWTGFSRGRAAAFDTDALGATRPIEYPVVTPAEAEGMFDVLTYEKGASVVRMLEQYLGEEPFRDGVRHYLRTHAHANTETSDLWDALEQVTGEPVRRIMDGWIHQGGFPLVEIEASAHGTTLRQRHFTLDPDAADDRCWSVPLRIRTGIDAPIRRLLLEGDHVELTGPDVPITVNAGASGFFRVRLPPATVDRIALGDELGLEPAERHGIVDDAWALTVAGETSAADYLRLAAGFAADDDLNVWQALATGFQGLTRIVDDDATPILKARIAGICRPVAARLGEEPGPDDDDRRRETRATILRLLGAVADDELAITRARRQLEHPDAGLAAAALTVVAHHGDAADNERIRAAWQRADDPQSEQRNLRALADFPSPELVGRMLAETIDGTIRSQDGAYLIRRALLNRHAGASTWAFVVDHWDEILATFPSNSIDRMLEGIVALDRPEQAEDVRTFLDAHPVPQAAHQIAQHLEHQRVNAALREREIERFSTHLRE